MKNAFRFVCILLFTLCLSSCTKRLSQNQPTITSPDQIAQVSFQDKTVVVLTGNDELASITLGADIQGPFQWRLDSPDGYAVSVKVIYVRNGEVFDDVIPRVGDRRVFKNATCTKVVIRPGANPCEIVPRGWSIIEVFGHTVCERARKGGECVEVFQKTGELRGYSDPNCTMLVKTFDLHNWACSVP